MTPGDIAGKPLNVRNVSRDEGLSHGDAVQQISISSSSRGPTSAQRLMRIIRARCHGGRDPGVGMTR